MIHILKWFIFSISLLSVGYTEQKKELSHPKVDEKLSTPYVQTLLFNPHAQLNAKLSRKGLTRLSLEGDRIASLFVETGVLTQVADEASGQWFIQPKQPERQQSVPLSIITINGHTQDLKLSITDVPSAAIRLRIPKMDTTLPVESFKASRKEENALMLFKAVMQNQIQPHPKRSTPRRKQRQPWTTLHYQKEYPLEGYIISQWRIVNHRTLPVTLQENAFYETGDIALTFIQRQLKSRASTTLFIMRSAR